jgi:serine/threonine protein kinase
MNKIKAERRDRYPTYESICIQGVTYKFGHQLSVGSTCAIYKAYDSFKTKLVLKEYTNLEHQELWLNEIHQYQTLNHRNMVRMVAHHVDEHSALLVLERVSHTLGMVNLSDDPDVRARMAYGVARGLLDFLNYLHSRHLIHSDINPNNVLIQTNLSTQAFEDVKVCDHALIKKVGQDQYGLVAGWVLPPEYLTKTHGPTFGMDIYHAALVIFQVLSGKSITFTEDDILSNRHIDTVMSYGGPIAGVLATALINNPELRPSAIDLWTRLIEAYSPVGKVVYH